MGVIVIRAAPPRDVAQLLGVFGIDEHQILSYRHPTIEQRVDDNRGADPGSQFVSVTARTVPSSARIRGGGNPRTWGYCWSARGVRGGGVVRVRLEPTKFDFVMQLDNVGVSYVSIIDMIDIGKAVCHDLRSGSTPPVVLGKLQATGFAASESAIILVSAVNNMCVDTKPAVVGWARDNGYTGPV